MGSHFRLDIARRALEVAVVALLIAGFSAQSFAEADDPPPP